MNKHGKGLFPLFLTMVFILLFSALSFAQNGTITSRETSDPLQTGYARWIKITVKGGAGGNDNLNDNFQGVQMLVDLNIDGDDDYTTPANPPLTIGKDSYYASGDVAGDIVSYPPGTSGGANDSTFFVAIKQGKQNRYPDSLGYETSLRPRIQLTNSGALRVGSAPFTFSIANETDLFMAKDGIKPVIKAVYSYDDGSGATNPTANHKGNKTAFDGYIDRLDLVWSEAMRDSNTTVNTTIFPNPDPSTIYGFEGTGTWYGKRRFTIKVMSFQPNTGITPILRYYPPTTEAQKFREAATSQNRYYALSQERGITDRAGPAIISARTMRASRRQPLANALTSKLIEVTFSEPVERSSVQVGNVDFKVRTTVSGADTNVTNDIASIQSPSAAVTRSSIYVFALTQNFESENEIGTIVFTADSVVTDAPSDSGSNYNGASRAPQPPTRPLPSRGAVINIADGIYPNITRFRTVDAALNAELASGGTNGWGYLDYVDVLFDHAMDTTRKSTSGFVITGAGIQGVGGTGKWLSVGEEGLIKIFRIPLVATNPAIANTGVIPTLSYTNPDNPTGLRDAINAGLTENLLTSDINTSADNGLAVVRVDSAGPAIVQSYTAGNKRIRITFSEKVNTAGWPTTPPAAPSYKFRWVVGPSYYNFPVATREFFTGLSGSNSDSVVYLNHNGTAWAKTDSGGINFDAAGIVAQWNNPANTNSQRDDDNSLNAPARVKQGSDVKVQRDNIAPILLRLETADLSKNGKLDHYRLVFDDLSPIFPRASFRSNLWTITGYDGAKGGLQIDLNVYNPAHAYYQPTAINSFGDTVEVFIKFNETVGVGPAATPYNGDTGDVPNVAVATGNGFADWADNVMSALPNINVPPKDKAGPAIMSATTINTTQVEVLMSEDLLDGSAETSDFRLTMGKDLNLLSVQEVAAGKLKASAFDQDYWLPTQTGTIALVGENRVYDNISGADNGNMQTSAIPVNDHAASQFDVNLAIEGDVIRGVPFQIEVIARDSHGNVDTNFPEMIVFSSNLTQNEIDLPDGPQPLEGGMGFFDVTSWKTTDNLIISVSVNSDRYARFFSESAPINVVEPVIDSPDTLIVKDYRGIDGLGDQGGFVALVFDYSDNHPGIGTQNVIDYYQLYREFDHDVWDWGTFVATDTTGSGADSMRLVVWTGDNVESNFWVRAVWDPSLPGTRVGNATSTTESIQVPPGYVLLTGNQPVLLRSKGKKIVSDKSQRSAVEGGDQVVSASVMGHGRASDNIAPKAPATLYADKDGLAVKLHWPKVTQGVNGMTEVFPIKYEILSHATNAYFDPAQGTLEATVTDTSYLMNGEQLRKFFCVRAVDTDNKSVESKRTGKWGFQMYRGQDNRYNYLSLPLETTFKKASDLATDVTGLAALHQLEAATNGFSKYYLPAINFGSNFTLKSGMPVLVSASPTAPTAWFYSGAVPATETVQFALVKGDKYMYNEIILPLDMTAITTADQLAQNIGGVEVVLKIDPATNAFTKFWLPGIKYGDNFAIQPGEPVLINVNKNAPSVWPDYSARR